MARDAEPRYIPAARWRAFTRLYDPVLALTMREKRFRGEMLARIEADLPDRGTLVDLPAFVEEAGFDVERYGRFRTGFGAVELLAASTAARTESLAT